MLEMRGGQLIDSIRNICEITQFSTILPRKIYHGSSRKMIYIVKRNKFLFVKITFTSIWCCTERNCEASLCCSRSSLSRESYFSFRYDQFICTVVVFRTIMILTDTAIIIRNIMNNIDRRRNDILSLEVTVF